MIIAVRTGLLDVYFMKPGLQIRNLTAYKSLKRREAIKTIGIGLSTGIVLPSWLSACHDDQQKPATDYDGVVAVIGAGAAGLYAADILLSQGIKVTVFEASERLGGRAQTFRATDLPSPSLLFDPDYRLNHDFPLELGAEKIFGSDSLWGNTIRNQHIPLLDLRSVAPEDDFIIDGLLKTQSEAFSDDDVKDASIFLNSIEDYTGDNVSVKTVMEAGINARVYNILNSWIGNRYGTSNDRLSMLALADALRTISHDDAWQVLKSNPLQDALLSRFNNAVSKVKLNSPIKSIDYSGERIVLADQNNNTTLVDKVIVTVPVSILKSDDIQFTPALPDEKKSALDNIGMDASVRVALEFKKPVWREGIAFIVGGNTVPEYFNCGIGRSSLNKFLNVTVNGPAAETLSSMGDNMIDPILEELDGVLDGQASLNVLRTGANKVAAIVKDWTNDPYIKGGMSYSKPGGTVNDRETLAIPLNDKVFFAGEATDTKGDFGTVTGALQSAQRAAQEVVDSILHT